MRENAVRGGCSGCCRRRCGMRPESGMTCAAMCWSTSPIRARSWWWTKLAISKRAPAGRAPSGSTPAPAGRTENAQVAVYLTYAAPAGSAFIDRALYLPRSWTSDPARCQAAGVPRDTAFATKPALARQMICRALDAGTPAGWATADEVYGQDPNLRAELARHGLGYVLAVAKTHPVTTP